MKFSKGRVSHMAHSVITRLQESGHLEVLEDKKTAVDALDRVITDELSVEDRLNAEVRELMKQYTTQIERGGVDYQKMFTMIKTKLVKERGLIL